MIVIDASVALKWIFADEEGAADALSIRDAHISGESEVAVPSLFFYEVANVLATKVKLSVAEAQAAFRLFRDFEFQVYDLGMDDFLEAVRISHKHLITVYDACYLVLALRLDCRMATADLKLGERVSEYGVVELIGEHP
ncbi:MAG: type II toxin-antitoxin system VapC family toxin [Desulfomonile sp.]|nr:type II toxin-antitoxin system VapC family toxin [Desulfomonile sp.]